MSRAPKIILSAVGVLVGLAALAVVALRLFLDVGSYKPWLEAAASEVSGMEVVLGGQLRLEYLPHLAIRLQDVHVRKRGKDVLSADEATLGIDFLPLLQRKLRLGKIALKHPSITIEQDRDGTFNFENPEAEGRELPALNLTGLSLSNGTLHYVDKISGGEFVANGCRADVSDLHLSGGSSSDFMKDLSIMAELTCADIRTEDFTATEFAFVVTGKDGAFVLEPITLSVFGGHGTGSVHAAFTDATPRYLVRYSVAKFRIEDFFKAQVPQKVVEGEMEFAANLSIQGKTVRQMRQTARGTIFLSGRNLTVYGSDLDREFAQFQSSQSFNLVDVGAFFFAGPFGVAVTKGYNFASISRDPKSVSAIRALVSNWKVERGVAQAADVAMATKENRIALQGALDLVNERFNDVTVALIDAQGCATVQQKISGSFLRPVVEKPSMLRSLAGPVISLFNQGRGLFPGGKCNVFYSGSVAAPL